MVRSFFMEIKRSKIIFVLPIVALLAAGCLSNPENSGALRFSGTIEAEEITIASETGGRIVSLLVDRGDEVQAGDVLVLLESTMLDADLARTQSTVEALDAARSAAFDAWQAMLDLQANPLELDLKIAEVQAQLELAELQIQAAQLSGDLAALKVAETSRDGLRNVLDLLLQSRARPYALIAQASQAEMYYRTLESLLQVVLSTQEILQIQKEKTTLTAPRDGFVLVRSLAEGEVAAPLAPILVLADLEHLTIKVYISENALAHVQLGDEVSITVDSLPGQTFVGKVVYISPKAEFAPTTVQTDDQRARLVYAVEISLDNPNLILKQGMIVDVEFER
jgi:HlyD family secretion protein